MKKDKDNILFGKSLRKLRNARNLTQEEVAQLTGFDAKYISQLEGGNYMGTIKTMLKFCNAFNVTPNDILCDFINVSSPDKEWKEFYSDFLKLSSKDKKNIKALINSMVSD